MRFETQKRDVLDRDSRRKPYSEDMWTQSSFGTWYVRAHFFGNAHWSHAWVNQRGLCSRNKILPCSAQILFMIGTAFAVLVNARSSNHEPNQEADRDPKRLSERNSFLCEQALLASFLLPPVQVVACWSAEMTRERSGSTMSARRPAQSPRSLSSPARWVLM